uniref:Uncharacterized protein n=1 Tax=Timema poppense TaxID=170557 RepID=A0A7R9DSZ4_TIMPO|nr:unnamed protein product [Timema poppensis]
MLCLCEESTWEAQLLNGAMKIEKTFLEAVKTTLGHRNTENIENIYKVTIKFIIDTLIKGYEEKT